MLRDITAMKAYKVSWVKTKQEKNFNPVGTVIM